MVASAFFSCECCPKVFAPAETVIRPPARPDIEFDAPDDVI